MNGKQSRYINLDNAASTPSFKSVQKAVNNFLDFYSRIHRGSGFKSRLPTHFYEHSRSIGIEKIAEHESELTPYPLRRLAEIPSIRIFGNPNPETINNCLGVIPFTMNEISHFLVAAVLSCESGIGVRSGCFCAHPYLLHLLEISPQKAQQVHQNIMSGDRTDMPGIVRVSLGLYNTGEDIDALVESLQIIDRRDFQGKYFQDNASGEVIPKDWHPDFNSFFFGLMTCLFEKLLFR